MSADPATAYLPHDEGSRSAFSIRAIGTGLVLSAWITVWPSYTSLVLHSSRADHCHLPMAMLIPYMFLLVLNSKLERWGKSSFSPSELLTICCIGLVSACMQGEFLPVYLLEMISMPYYFASPENRFEELLLPHMPKWTTLTDRSVAEGFFEGVLPGTPFPWEAWLYPLFGWGTLIVAILCFNLCVSVLLRKQWMDHERLAFPVATALLELTGVSGTRGTLTTLAQNRKFQMGFGLTLAIITWNVATWFSVGAPMFPFLAGRYGRHVIPLSTGFPPLITTFVLLTFTLGYFTKLEVLFSMWFFHLLAKIQIGMFNRFGLEITHGNPFGSSHPAVGWMSFGGMIVFVCWGLFTARHHFREVYRKAFLNDQTVDDSDELISYRTAVWLLIGAGAFIILWLNQAGLDLFPALTFCFGTFVLYLGLARILVESGLVYLRTPISAQAFTWHIFGIAGLGPSGAAGLTLAHALIADGKTFTMAQFAHVPRLAMGISKRSRKAIAPAVMGGCIVGGVAAISFILYQGYHVMGSYNFGTAAFKGVGSLNAVAFGRLAVTRIQDGTWGTDWTRMLFLGIGGTVTALIYFLRYQFVGFPLHPIGFTISAMNEMQDNAFTIFLIWAIKSLILKVGGLESYRRNAPFFLGMMMGYIAGVALGVITDFFWFPGTGHEIHCDP